MRTQTSILESGTHNPAGGVGNPTDPTAVPMQQLVESPLKQLNGNQEVLPVRVRYSVAQRFNWGYTNHANDPDPSTFGTVAAEAQLWTIYANPDFTGLIDIGSRYAASKASLLGFNWPTDWVTPGRSIYYDDGPGPFQNGFSGNELVATPTPEGGGPAMNRIAAYSGYELGTGGSRVYTLWRGQLRFDGPVNDELPLYYWIGRFRSSERNLTFRWRWEFLSDGFITSLDPSGFVVRECPFTIGAGAPPSEGLFDSSISRDFNFLVFQTGSSASPHLGDTFV